MIQAFLAKWGTKLLAALAVIGTALGALKMYGRGKKREGASEEREKQTEKVLENVEEADKARRDQRSSGKRDRVSKFDRK